MEVWVWMSVDIGSLITYALTLILVHHTPTSSIPDDFFPSAILLHFFSLHGILASASAMSVCSNIIEDLLKESPGNYFNYVILMFIVLAKKNYKTTKSLSVQRQYSMISLS